MPRVQPGAGRRLMRFWAVLLVCLGGLVVSPAGAGAAHITGPSSAPYGQYVTLLAHYTGESPYGCGIGTDFCYATIYYYEGDGTKRLYSYCGTPSSGHTDPCEISASPMYGGDRVLSDPSYAKYEICEGAYQLNCGSKVVTWDPPVVNLALRGEPNGDGSVRARLTAGEHGFLGGGVTLYDESQRKTVRNVYGDDEALYWDLPGCAGPYFRAKLTVGEETRQTGLVRINGITNNGEPCHDDPAGGGGGDGGDDGGGPPAPPTPILEGPSQVSALEPAELTVRASTPTEYPYWLIVRDTSANDQVVGSCQAKGTCTVTVHGDPGATGPEVHHLVAETVFGGDVLATSTKDVTFLPFRTQAQIKSVTVSDPEPDAASAGNVTVRIANVDRGPAFGYYDLYLEARDVTSPGSQWQYVSRCTGQKLACDIDYTAAPHDQNGAPRTIKFRATISYLGEIRDRSPVRTIEIFHGTDHKELMAIAPSAEAEICPIIIAANRGEPVGNTTVSRSAAVCAGILAGGPALALTYFLQDTDPELLGETLASILNAIRDVNIAVPLPGTGGGATTSGKQYYDGHIDVIARSLRQLNQGVSELTRTTAKAVAAACLATAGYRPVSALVGVSLGPKFCKTPTMPIFVVGANVNEAAQHDFDAIFGNVDKNMPPHPSWAVLNYASAARKTSAGQPSDWYRNDPLCANTGGSTGNDCDEYPYFSSQQGGSLANPKPSLRPVNLTENRREGSLLYHRLIRRCGLDSATGITKTSNGTGGSAYLVLPMPLPGGSNVGSFTWKPILSYAPLTFGICNRGSGGGVSQ